ncbi:MAG: SDR family oxidoreductase [Bacteroidota bacterium]
MENIRAKNVLITGGSKGIGYGIAEVLLQHGLNVAITSRSQKAADEAANSLSKIETDAKVLALEADVRDMLAMDKAVEATRGAFGGLDVVIANAGIGKFASIEDLTPQDWFDTIDINLNGVFNTVKSTLPSLKESKGYLMTIASLAGTNFFARGAAYNASKFGLVGFTQAVMLDLRQYDIKVTTIMPGSVTSHFNDHTPNEADAWKIQPEDLGQMVIDLLRMHPRTLPSKIEVRPTKPPTK